MKAAFESDDVLKMIRPQPFENHVRVLDRLVGGHCLSHVCKMRQHFSNAGIECRVIEAMSQIVPYEPPQCFVECATTALTDRQAQQLFDTIPHKSKYFLDRPLRQPQLGQR